MQWWCKLEGQRSRSGIFIPHRTSSFLPPSTRAQRFFCLCSDRHFNPSVTCSTTFTLSCLDIYLLGYLTDTIKLQSSSFGHSTVSTVNFLGDNLFSSHKSPQLPRSPTTTTLSKPLPCQHNHPRATTSPSPRQSLFSNTQSWLHEAEEENSPNPPEEVGTTPRLAPHRIFQTSRDQN